MRCVSILAATLLAATLNLQGCNTSEQTLRRLSVGRDINAKQGSGKAGLVRQDAKIFLSSGAATIEGKMIPDAKRPLSGDAPVVVKKLFHPSNAGRAVGGVIPERNGKLTGMTFGIPMPAMSPIRHGAQRRLPVDAPIIPPSVGAQGGAELPFFGATTIDGKVTPEQLKVMAPKMSDMIGDAKGPLSGDAPVVVKKMSHPLNAAKADRGMIPELNGERTGRAYRVPMREVSPIIHGAQLGLPVNAPIGFDTRQGAKIMLPSVGAATIAGNVIPEQRKVMAPKMSDTIGDAKGPLSRDAPMVVNKMSHLLKAAKADGGMIQELNGERTHMEFRVPTPKVSPIIHGAQRRLPLNVPMGSQELRQGAEIILPYSGAATIEGQMTPAQLKVKAPKESDITDDAKRRLSGHPPKVVSVPDKPAEAAKVKEV